MNIKQYKTEFAGKELTIEFGKLAQAANSSLTIQMGDTVVMVTATMSSRETNLPYFPLMVDYEEKLYAAGRIKGSRFIKREGRPSDEAVLVGRFIDRALRPLFPSNLKREVQVIATTLSFDEEHDPDILALIGASCALHTSDIPWNGPIAAARVSLHGETWKINATYEERQKATFDLDVAGNAEKVIMIEARADETDEETLKEAFAKGRQAMAPIVDLIEQIRSDIGKEKLELPQLAEDKAKAIEEAKAFIATEMEELFFAHPLATKGERNQAKGELSNRLEAHLTEKGFEENAVEAAKNELYDLIQIEVAKQIVENGRRLDGRKIDELREIKSEVDLLPRVHGSGLFDRGETQVLSVCTLGAPGDEQTLDSMESVGEKRYMHHYNFPPYSVGETKFLRGPGRREIGHGALAEKALEGMMPEKADFPYTIRVVSEVLNSNGSSSMASTCGSTLALMAAGVPIKEPVAGIAIGLATYGDKQIVLTDLQDLEDGPGGMDFKVTGTKNGVTAIQMDTKTDGLTHEVVIEALDKAKTARLQILEVMLKAIPTVREELSPYAPRIITMTIHPDKIREVIGAGGKVINEIIEKTAVDAIDIENDGTIMITAKDLAAGEKAYNWINELTRDIEVGEAFEAKITRIMDFGAIAEFGQGKDGMIHISELAPYRVEKVEDIVKMGDVVNVKVITVDKEADRISLSMKQAEGNTYPEAPKRAPQSKDGKKPFKKPFKRNGDK